VLVSVPLPISDLEASYRWGTVITFTCDLDPNTPGYQGKMATGLHDIWNEVEHWIEASFIDIYDVTINANGEFLVGSQAQSILVDQDASMLAWSPDGEFIAYGHLGLYMIQVNFENGLVQKLGEYYFAGARPEGVCWSPDSKYLVFSGGSSIVRATVARDPVTGRAYASEVKALTSGKDTDRWPNWNPAWVPTP
jgi:hypothetical protein